MKAKKNQHTERENYVLAFQTEGGLIDFRRGNHYLDVAASKTVERLYHILWFQIQPLPTVFVVALNIGGHKPYAKRYGVSKPVAPNRTPPESMVSEGDIKEISVHGSLISYFWCEALGVRFVWSLGRRKCATKRGSRVTAL